MTFSLNLKKWNIFYLSKVGMRSELANTCLVCMEEGDRKYGC